MKQFGLHFVVLLSSGRYMRTRNLSSFAVINAMINVARVRFHFVTVLSDVMDEQLRSVYHQYR